MEGKNVVLIMIGFLVGAILGVWIVSIITRNLLTLSG